MELTSLRYFTAVASELHFRRAAAKLHITQAPLSAAIRKLEEELGVRLFERTSRSVRLTPAGLLFLKEATAILDRTESALKRISHLTSEGKNTLSIGYNEPALNTFLPELLRHCREQMPLLQLKLRELETAEQLELLAREKLDIGFIRRGGSDFSDFNSKLLFRENYLLAMPENHPLATKNTLYCRDLSDQDLILFSREVNPEIFDRIVSALTPDSLPPPRFLQYARNKSSMQVLVQAGFGAALMPESCCQNLRQGVVVRKIRAQLPEIEIVAVWKKEYRSTALESFIKLLPEPLNG